MRIYSPPGYVRLYDARRKLAARMQMDTQPSGDIQALRNKGYEVEDGAYATLASGALIRAIRSGVLHLCAHIPSKRMPIRLDKEILDAAFSFEPETAIGSPNDRQDRVVRSSVLTLAYLDRHAGAPFGLSWLELRELMRAGLYFEEAEFKEWLEEEETKAAWPCREIVEIADHTGNQSKPHRVRARYVEDDAKLRIRIESVLASARRRWKDLRRRPSARDMAKVLVVEIGQKQDFSEETIRKILTGKYSVMQRLGIKGLTG